MSNPERTFHAHLMDAQTGEAVVYTDEWDDHGWEASEYPRLAKFQWAENNYACDCNRLPFFCRAKGIEEPEHATCGEPLILCRLMHGDKELFSDWIESPTQRALYVERVLAQREKYRE